MEDKKTKDPNCLFCKIVDKEIPSENLYEDDDFIAIMDINPNNFGHSLVIPKEHYENIYDLKGRALTKFGEVVQKISIAVKKAMKADGINVHINNDPAAGQVIFHSHTHIIPRFNDDGLRHWPQKQYYSPDQIKEVRDKIRHAID